MASRKRHRNLDDPNGELEVDRGTSSLRYSSQKRSRTALTTPREQSVVSDEEDSDANDGPVDTPQGETISSPAPSYDQQEDSDDVDDTLLARASKIVGIKFDEERENIPAEQGIIEEVFCRNFMCHSKLRIKLGPLINFIIGHNGSGKSAVLTALQMCLGGKAAATNRGASLKDFIKQGEESSTLVVKIKNQGEGAYKPELFGPSIIVERHFTRSGTSGFKIKSSEDKVITTKKADLEDILDFFAFQLDNPINVLTQDSARQFLIDSSSSLKYKFFLSGTQLERLDKDYNIVDGSLMDIEDRLRQSKEDVDVLRENAKAAEKKKKQLDDIANVQARIDKYTRMQAWALVEEQEALLEKYKQDVSRAEDNAGQEESALQTSVGKLEGHTQTFERAQQDVTKWTANINPLSETTQKEKAAFDSNKKELQNAMSDQRGIKQSMDRCTKDIEVLNRKIDEEKQRLSQSEGGAHAGRLAALEEFKKKVTAAQARVSDHDKERPVLEQARSRALEEAQRSKSEQKDVNDRLTAAQSTLTRLQRHQGQKFAGYLPNTEAVIHAINREKGWQSKPVGPMGAHITLLKPEWASVIERVFGGNLNAFVVTCKQDQNKLSSIMKSVKFQGSVFISSTTRLDTAGKEPEDANVSTLLSALQFDNDKDLVRNTLIFTAAIEQIVLIKDREEAHKYLFNNPAGRPRNVKAVIAMAAKRGAGLRFEFTGSGEQKSGFIQAWEGQTRMKADHGVQLRLQQEQVEHAKAEVNKAELVRQQRETQFQEAGDALKRFAREHTGLRRQMQQAEDQVEAARNEIEGNQPQHGRLQEWELQLEAAKGNLHEEEVQYRDSEVALSTLAQTGAELKTKLDQAEAELQKARDHKEKAEEKLRRCEVARSQAIYEKSEAEQKVEVARQHVARLQQKQDEQQRRVDEDAGEASQICPREPVEAGKTPQILDELLSQLNADRRNRERLAGGTREELTAAWHVAERAFLDAKRQMTSLVQAAKALETSLDERQRRWRLFRKYITLRARSTFTFLLSARRFRGQMLLDHAAERLDISVEPDITRTSGGGRQARTLSGGEKSFSTICVLLSIWEAMGSPIRCLDEFDVYMDAANRSMSMSLMIQAARRAIGRQFILITPQAMSNVELKNDVRIHRMSDPERGQGTLPFGD